MAVLPSPLSALERVKREIERNGLRARNGIKMATGSARPGTGQSPKDVVWRSGRTELWHYKNDNVRYGPPLLIIFSLVSKSYIMDLSPGNSFIEKLLDAGLDVYLLDWGTPDERDAANTLEDYTDILIPAGIDEVMRRSGADEVNLLGYCFGGVLALMHAAHNPDSPLRSLTVVATPTNYANMGPLGDVIGTTDLEMEAIIGPDGNVPPEVIQQGFKSLKPMAEITSYVDLWERLWSDDYVKAYQAMTGWGNDHIPFPGAAARQMGQMLLRDNAFINDVLVLGGDHVSLSDIKVPFLAVLGKKDHIVPLECAGPLLGLIGSDDKQELVLDGGHIGLVVGRTAAKTTIPTIIDFLISRSEEIS